MNAEVRINCARRLVPREMACKSFTHKGLHRINPDIHSEDGTKLGAVTNNGRVIPARLQSFARSEIRPTPNHTVVGKDQLADEGIAAVLLVPFADGEARVP